MERKKREAHLRTKKPKKKNQFLSFTTEDKVIKMAHQGTLNIGDA